MNTKYCQIFPTNTRHPAAGNTRRPGRTAHWMLAMWLVYTSAVLGWNVLHDPELIASLCRGSRT